MKLNAADAASDDYYTDASAHLMPSYQARGDIDDLLKNAP